ncbi:MAG: hypothetical protein QOJ89_4302 [bacterium]|jgi:hypothetical protein
MGGLIIRYALAAVALHHPDFPPLLRVDDVVTLGTPHGGARGPWSSFEGAEMRPGSDFLKSLQRVPRPEGVGGSGYYKLHAAATVKGTVAYESLSSSPFESHVVAMTWPVRRTYLSLTSASM